MKKRIDISKCSCGSTEIEIVGVPAMALTGRKASCFIRCKKCLFTVMPNDLSKASSEKLAGFWNYLQRAKNDRSIWKPKTDVPPQDCTSFVFETQDSLLFGNFLGVTGEKWCVRTNGQMMQIDPCCWCHNDDFNKSASGEKV